MQYCYQCRVSVRGEHALCPLCQSRLNGEPDEPLYPQIKSVYKQFHILFKVLLASTISAAVICVGINLIFPDSGVWSVFVVFGVIGFWISLVTTIKRLDNFLKNITLQAFVLSVFSVLLDLLMGWRGWCLDYFIPITYSVTLLSLYVIAKVKSLPEEDYIIYIISSLLFSVIPTVFYFLGWLSVVIPSIICMILSVVTLVFLIVFEGKKLLLEINKRFHL